MVRDTEYIGRNGFFWFHGVVEDRIDPDKLGRLKVRILGCHTKDKTYIKTEDLQWAYVVQPLTSAAMNGIGQTPLGPVPGTWVLGYFRDGEEMQEPCILGTVGGIPQSAAVSSVGFNDPRDEETDEKLASAPRKIQSRQYPTDGSGATLTSENSAKTYPRVEHPLGCVVGEPDTNRIARNEQIEDTIIQVIKDNLDKGVPIAFEGTWNEMDTWYKGQYPFVHVHETESGHIHVKDDTPDSEGTLEWDRSGTFKEVLTDGSEVHKIVKNGYTIILSKNHIHIMNDQNERCDKEYNLSVGGRWNVEVEGNINLLCHGNMYAKVEGSTNITTGMHAKIGVEGNADVNVKGHTKITSGGPMDVKSGSALNITAASKISMLAGGSMHIKASDFAVDAGVINLNSGVAAPTTASSAGDPEEPKK